MEAVFGAVADIDSVMGVLLFSRSRNMKELLQGHCIRSLDSGKAK